MDILNGTKQRGINARPQITQSLALKRCVAAQLSSLARAHFTFIPKVRFLVALGIKLPIMIKVREINRGTIILSVKVMRPSAIIIKILLTNIDIAGIIQKQRFSIFELCSLEALSLRVRNMQKK
ncbi:MAG: hypothetical protein IJW02_07975 [Clostridia bacterium]|nr:hypothetical protein [Clostridia bacterium]MBQ7391022.1 hypothetical protein [Clostridia bacterium]